MLMLSYVLHVNCDLAMLPTKRVYTVTYEGVFVHFEQNSGRDKTQVLGETQVFLPKTQLFFSPKLRFPKLSKSLYYISFSKTQPEQSKTQVKIPKTQVSETFLIFNVSKSGQKKA